MASSKISKKEIYELIVNKTTKLVGRKRSFEEMYTIAIENDLYKYDSRIPAKAIEIEPEDTSCQIEWYELITMIKNREKNKISSAEEACCREVYLSCLSKSELLDIYTKNT